jgi:predicted Zn-dependent protease
MSKAIIQLLALVLFFFGMWFGLSKIDWVTILNVKKAAQSTEEKLGKLLWEVFRKQDDENRSPELSAKIDSLVDYICDENSIDRKKIKLHVLQNDEVNAFTLPDNYLVIYTGLIKEADNEGELVGVICHEIAHMQKNHVMKKLVKEIGLSALIGMTGSGGKTVSEVAKLLSSSAYDRDLEREADITGVDYMIKAEMDPEPLANFLYRLSSDDLPSQVYWVSTHPESKERAEAIVEYIKDKDVEKKKILSEESWKVLKAEAADN